MLKNIFLVVSLMAFAVTAVAIIFINKDNSKLHTELTEKGNEIAKLQQEIEEIQSLQGLQTDFSEINTVTGFFNTYLGYTNDTYESRFNELTKYANQTVISKLKGASVMQAPILPIKNELLNMEIYMSPARKNSFLVYVTTNYVVDGIAINNLNTLYSIQLESTDGGYQIVEIVSKGNLTQVDDV